MSLIKRIVEKSLLRRGYTLIKGDIRKEIKDNANLAELPSHLLNNAKVCANRNEVLKNLPTGGTIVEVGVAYGDFSYHLMNVLRPETFIAIDSFAFTKDNEPWARTTLKDEQTSHLAYYQNRFKTLIEAGKVIVKNGLSWEMLAELPDCSIDYVYVDADHSYQSVAREIQVLKHKIKPQGIIQFNDYTFFDQHALMPYGVPKAVHEFMIEENYELLYLCLHPQGFYDLVVKKM